MSADQPHTASTDDNKLSRRQRQRLTQLWRSTAVLELLIEWAEHRVADRDAPDVELVAPLRNDATAVWHLYAA